MEESNSKFIKPERGSTKSPDHIMLSFCGDPHTEIAVTWRTDSSVTESFLYVKKRTDNIVEKYKAITEYKETDIDRSNYHWVKLSGLEPGCGYIYSVGNDVNRSQEYSFTTEKEKTDRFSFLVITDHQRGSPTMLPDYSNVGRLLKQALNDHPECKFILTIGDNCDNGQNDLQWNGMFTGLKGIIENIPYMMTTGNHDNRGFLSYFPEPTGKFYLDHADFFDFQFKYSYPVNGPTGYSTENYSFDYGNTHFTVMGINAPETVADWAYEDIHSSQKTWKLASYHFPIYPVMPEGQNDDGYPALRKPIDKGRPDILFAGHEHSFARTYPMMNDEMYDKPSQGVVHYIAGNGGGNIYHSNCRKIWHSAFFPQEEKAGLYSVIDIDGEILTATAYMEDGRIVDKMIIDKRKDEILPYALAPVYDKTKMSFKGYMIELCARENYAEKTDGKWFAPLGVVIQAIGGKVIKEMQMLYCEVYNHSALFELNSRMVRTDSGTIELSQCPYMKNGQFYVPVDETAEIFDLDWYYSERNNIINWNTPHEEKPLCKHPEKEG